MLAWSNYEIADISAGTVLRRFEFDDHNLIAQRLFWNNKQPAIGSLFDSADIKCAIRCAPSCNLQESRPLNFCIFDWLAARGDKPTADTDCLIQ